MGMPVHGKPQSMTRRSLGSKSKRRQKKSAHSLVRSCSSVCILQNASCAQAGSYAGRRLKGACSFLFAVLEVPNGTRAGMSLMERGVSLRSRSAISSLGGVILCAGLPNLLAPAVALQFLRDNPLGLGRGRLTVQFTGVMAPQAALHLLVAACGLLQVVAGINRPVFWEPRLGHQPACGASSISSSRFAPRPRPTNQARLPAR
jgi:hypothetical protein